MNNFQNSYSEVKNPEWVNEKKEQINCEVNFYHVNGEEFSLFCANPSDSVPYSKQIFDECVSGKWGEIVSNFPDKDT